MFSSNTSQVASTSSALAEAIDFDGTNDWLSRSTDFTGNTDGKTFTFSAWIWYPTETATQYVFTSGQGFEVTVRSTTGGSYIQILGRNAAGTTILQMDAQATTNPSVTGATFFNLLISVDLTNTASRSIYINDVASNATWTTYTNDNIDFTLSANNISVAASRTGTNKYKGRLSNLFLDYTYRSLATTGNRRLFVTADLKPAAGQAALNPILYLPMSDPTQPGLNAGTGGNFTLTGTVARSGRGPNQYNAPYSDFDGTADYLSRTSIAGLSDSKTFTFSCTFISDENNHFVVCFGNSTTARRFVVYSNGQIAAENASGALVLNVQSGSPTLIPGRNYNLVVSVDLSDVNKRHYYVNGVSQGNWATYVNDLIDFVPTTPAYRIGNDTYGAQSDYFNGRLGALWFSTSYIDLSQPANLAKFVTGTGINAKPVDLGANGELPTGTSPLIYLPLYGNNAGRNYGTGGNFTVVSGPYTGARGPNEFWGNWAVFNDTDYLLRSSISLSTSTITLSFFITVTDVSGDGYIFEGWTSGNSTRFRCNLTGARYLRLEGWDSSGVKVLDITSNGTLSGSTTTYHVAISFNLTNSAQRHFYINNVDVASSWGTYSSGTMDIAKTYISSNNLPLFNSKLAEFYLSTTYVDFSQEANRLKFRDAFGNPTDLPSAITALSVPNPAIYMRFPPTAFGTNSGTGGNFTVNGTITDGGQL